MCTYDDVCSRGHLIDGKQSPSNLAKPLWGDNFPQPNPPDIQNPVSSAATEANLKKSIHPNQFLHERVRTKHVAGGGGRGVGERKHDASVAMTRRLPDRKM